MRTAIRRTPVLAIILASYLMIVLDMAPRRASAGSSACGQSTLRS